MKKFVPIILALVLILSLSVFAAESERNLFKNTDGLSVQLISQDPLLPKPGQNVELKFRVQNFAYNTLDAVKLNFRDTAQFKIIDNKQVIVGDLFSDIKGTDSLIFSVIAKVNDNVNEGTYYLDVDISVENNEINYKFFEVKVNSDSKNVGVNSVEYSKEQYVPGDIANIKINLENTNTEPLNNVLFKLDLENLDIAPFGSTSKKVINTVGANEEFSVEYNLILDPNTASQVYKIPFTYTYEDVNNEEFQEQGVFALVVSNPSSLITNLVESESFVEGDSKEFTIGISNNGNSELKFLYIELLSGDGYDVVRPNEQYVGNLEPDDFETATFSLARTVDESASFPARFKITYKDDFNKEYEQVVSVNLDSYSISEAQSLGLVKSNNSLFGVLFGLSIATVAIVFWLFMLFDLLNNKHIQKQKRMFWLILLIGTNVTLIGALIYYFIGRKVN